LFGTASLLRCFAGTKLFKISKSVLIRKSGRHDQKTKVILALFEEEIGGKFLRLFSNRRPLLVKQVFPIEKAQLMINKTTNFRHYL
jgi:hypothetical protein